MKGWIWTNNATGIPDLRVTEFFDSAVDDLANRHVPESQKADALMFLQFLASSPEKRAAILKALDEPKGSSS